MVITGDSEQRIAELRARLRRQQEEIRNRRTETATMRQEAQEEADSCAKNSLD